MTGHTATIAGDATAVTDHRTARAQRPLAGHAICAAITHTLGLNPGGLLHPVIELLGSIRIPLAAIVAFRLFTTAHPLPGFNGTRLAVYQCGSYAAAAPPTFTSRSTPTRARRPTPIRGCGRFAHDTQAPPSDTSVTPAATYIGCTASGVACRALRWTPATTKERPRDHG